MSSPTICIVGAGVIGLSVALYLAQEQNKSNPDNPVEIVVIANTFYDETTSFGSAGYWEPYKIEGTPRDLVHTWGKSTFDHFDRLYNNSEHRLASGIRLLDAFHLHDISEDFKVPFWKDIVIDYRVLSSEDLDNMKSLVPSGTFFPAKSFASGATFKSFAVDQSYYLKDLKNRLDQLGVKFAQRKVNNITELCNEGFDVIVNCCGIQGSAVAEDPVPCYPIRGQVIRISAPLMQSIWFFGTSYIAPNIDSVVCGGTSQVNNWDTTESLEDSKKIMDDIYEMFPSVIDAPKLNVWAGLRPSRTPLRLDSEIRKRGSALNDVLVCHCYGHGGSGVTLSWGCAEDIVLNHILPFLPSIIEKSRNRIQKTEL